MKLYTLLAILLLSSSLFGQMKQQRTKPNYNRWSIDVNAGLNKTVRNFAPGYGSALADFGELNFGVRRMFNAYVGLDLKLGFDRFQNGKDSPDFSTNFGRIQLDGIVNVGNVLNFYEWTDKLGLLAHIGVGRANIVDNGFPLFRGNDRVGTLTFGLTPQLKLGKKWSVNLDASIIGLGRLHHTWDFTQATYNGPKGIDYGFNGYFFTGTVGVSYYLGKKEHHADWSPTKTVSKAAVDSLRAEMERMRMGMNDDDQDGVPNYLDQEPSTAAGTPVDAQGRMNPSQMDADKDGIADNHDFCPDEKGPFSTNGCPDQDGDGIADKKDKCPDVKGSMELEGCPGSKRGFVGSSILSSANENVYFETASSELTTRQKAKLDALALDLQTNPSYKIYANGHADNRGTSEYNKQLSTERAQVVKDYLVKKGVDSSRIEIYGFGEEKPDDSNETVSGRANNRRVEFQITN